MNKAHYSLCFRRSTFSRATRPVQGRLEVGARRCLAAKQDIGPRAAIRLVRSHAVETKCRQQSLRFDVAPPRRFL